MSSVTLAVDAIRRLRPKAASRDRHGAAARIAKSAALGAVGYYLLSGKHVFEGKTVMEMCSHHLHSSPLPIAERLGKPVPADLEALLLACLRKAPDERPGSATPSTPHTVADPARNRSSTRRFWAR